MKVQKGLLSVDGNTHHVSKATTMKQRLHFSNYKTFQVYYYYYYYYYKFFMWRCDPTRVMVSSFLRFLDHTQRRTTVGRTPLDE
jgi:hypothetical protein